MGVQGGSITTDIIRNGLIFNMDAANRASTIPSTSTTKTFNTVDTSISGTFADNAQWEGPTTSSFAFDGTDDRIILGSSFDCGVNSTISCWAKLQVTQARTIFGEDSYGLDYLLYIGPTQSILRIGSSYMPFSDADISVNSWSYIAVVRAGDNGVFYLNSVEVGNTSTWTGGSPGSTTTKFDTIGAKTGGSDAFLGKVANIHIYNRALSANEVLHNYNALKGRFGL